MAEPPATQKVTVEYQTAAVTATGGVDFTHIPNPPGVPPLGMLTFEPGETRKEIEITIKADNVEDSGEYFWVSFEAPKPASVVRWPAGQHNSRFATVTIINDEADLEGLKLWGAPGAGGP